MNNNRVLAWDFDGTLAYRPGGWAGALLDVLKKEAPELPATAEQIRPYLQSGFPWHAPENPHPGLSADEWWEELQPVFLRAFRAVGVPGPRAWAMADSVRAAYTDPAAWQRYDDSLPALVDLSAQGWTHVLLSNHVPELPALLDHLELTRHFAAVFNSAQTGVEKPNTKAFRPVVEWAGPGAVLTIIGDSYPADIIGAREAGLAGILVRGENPSAETCCQSLRELAALLRAS